ncbi:MAG: serine hydrolase domain-containing protein [Gemmatimonadaceae bacterium]
MTAPRSLALALLLAVALAACGSRNVADPAAVAAPAASLSTIDRAAAIVRDSMAVNGPPGVSIAVGVNDSIVWTRGFGWANVENAIAVTPETRFRVGSVSKSLAAAGLARLVDDGRMAWDASVYAYAIDFPRKRWDFTVRQLGGHLAGVRHYRGNEFMLNQEFPTVRDGLAVFSEDSLLFEPGTRYSYSTYGWNLMSYAMERAAGTDFLTYMRTRVFEPLALSATGPDVGDRSPGPVTRFYGRTPGGWGEEPPVNSSYKWAGGGFLSTPDDLVRFGFGLLDLALVSRASRDVLWTSQATRDGVATEYGVGFFTRIDDAGRRVVYHSGGSIGGTTHLLIYPAERVVVAITGNGSDIGWLGSGRVARQVADVFIKAMQPKP